MIAARLAGGNLFFAFLWWGILGGGFCGALGAARSTRIFLRGFFGGDLLEHSEQLGALGFFFEGIFGWGILFLGGGGWVLEVCFGLKVLEKIKK